jgi:hypothetical protein
MNNPDSPSCKYLITFLILNLLYLNYRQRRYVLSYLPQNRIE